MLNYIKLTAVSNDSDVQEVAKKHIYQSHTLLFIYIYICLFILTFMVLLLGDRSTEGGL